MMQGKWRAGNVNTDEKHETQSSAAGSKGKTHISAFNFFFSLSFFFSIILAPKNMISLQQRIRLIQSHLQRMELPCVAPPGLNQLFPSPEIPWLPVSTGISWRNPKQAIPN